jgi:hypothetical protein
MTWTPIFRQDHRSLTVSESEQVEARCRTMSTSSVLCLMRSCRGILTQRRLHLKKPTRKLLRSGWRRACKTIRVCFQEFLSHPYWSRVWTFQEFVLPIKVTILARDDSCDWVDFARVHTLIKNRHCGFVALPQGEETLTHEFRTSLIQHTFSDMVVRSNALPRSRFLATWIQESAARHHLDLSQNFQGCICHYYFILLNYLLVRTHETRSSLC